MRLLSYIGRGAECEIKQHNEQIKKPEALEFKDKVKELKHVEADEDEERKKGLKAIFDDIKAISYFVISPIGNPENKGQINTPAPSIPAIPGVNIIIKTSDVISNISKTIPGIKQPHVTIIKLSQTPGQVPAQVPAQTPIQVPAQTPRQIPGQTPIQIPGQTPYIVTPTPEVIIPAISSKIITDSKVIESFQYVPQYKKKVPPYYENKKINDTAKKQINSIARTHRILINRIPGLAELAG